MEVSEKIFLTQKQAMEAIRIDFSQYESQFNLFQELCPIITDARTIVAKEGRNDCVLITRGKKSKMRHLKNHELGDFLFSTLCKQKFPLSVLSEICSKVFRTKSWPGQDSAGNVSGIWIKTEMAKFQCRRCGNCCRNLKYHNDCTENDYRRWEALGCDDIMENVMIIEPNGKPPRYKIWKKPGTEHFYPECPWLIPASSKGLFECAIQDVKPEYCRQYPLTRKHAEMTGCKGTFKSTA